MPHATPEICRRFSTLQREVDALVPAMAAALHRDSALVIVFVSSAYDLDALAPALRAAFTGVVIGCTTAGEIGASGYQRGGLTAMSFDRDYVRAETWAFDLTTDDGAERVCAGVEEELSRTPSEENAAGVLLLDGLSSREERAAAALYRSLGHLPIVGGSAGDDLAFERTAVLDGDRFVSGRGTLTLIRTALPLTTFKYQHHVPTARRLVVTAADPELRVIHEIDGLPALEGYAAKLGVTTDAFRHRWELTRLHPLMLRVGSEHFVRSIREADDDGALHLYCAIDRGAVLSIGETRDAVSALRDHLDSLHRQGPIAALLVFDCILRRLELEERELTDTMGSLLSAAGAIGFSTYGEQFGPLHVNQTMVGLALGTPPHE